MFSVSRFREIKLIGNKRAYIDTCPVYNLQFSLWITDPNGGFCRVGLLSENNLITIKESVIMGSPQQKKGRETETSLAELLHGGAITTHTIALSYESQEKYYEYYNSIGVIPGGQS